MKRPTIVGRFAIFELCYYKFEVIKLFNLKDILRIKL